jgi:hypothetical protein
MDKNFTLFNTLRRHSRGQGLVEFALFFPILLVILSGLFEFGFMLNEYIDILDSAREASRFAADNNPFDENYNDRLDFYISTSDLALQTARPLELCVDANPLDGLRCGDDPSDEVNGDIVISVFGVAEIAPGPPPVISVGRHPQPAGFWSRFNRESSQFSDADILALLDPNAPNTGIVIVEVYYDYAQKFKLPWITPFVPDPIHIDSHTIMPLVAAEPTPTPLP